MKNKKVLIIVIILVVLLLGIFYYFMVFKDRKAKLSVHEAGNFTKYTGEVPELFIHFGGIVNTGVDQKILAGHGIYPYIFDAKIETNWGEYQDTYVGYKLKDILGIFNNLNYKSITAYNVSGLSVEYSLDSINSDSLFVVLYKDNKAIFDKKMAIISVLDNAQYYVDNVVTININDGEVK